MHCKRQWLSIIGLGLLVAGFGCKKTPQVGIEKDYWRELPPGQKALVKLDDPSMWPDFSEGYMRRGGLELAAMYNLEYLSKPSSKLFFPYLDVTHERAVASNHAFIEVLQTAASGPDLDRTIKERFDIYQSRGWDDKGGVLFTGYYRPIFDARLQPDAEYRHALYKRPPDLERNAEIGKYQRKGGGTYLTRANVNSGALAGKGLELCYLRDPFEAYIITVQGSGRLRLADGSLFDIGYHGDNGHDYQSVGQWLVDRGMIDPMQLSLPGLIKFFNEHPDQLQIALDYNPRYVFFTPRKGGPYGSLNVPVTPFRSIATDKQVYPRASVTFVDTLVPARTPERTIINHAYKGFAMDQDTGGAIRAAGRCDFFLGTGPEVGELAGRTLSEGKLYYIFVKDYGVQPQSDVVASPPSAAPPVEASPQPTTPDDDMVEWAPPSANN